MNFTFRHEDPKDINRAAEVVTAATVFYTTMRAKLEAIRGGAVPFGDPDVSGILSGWTKNHLWIFSVNLDDQIVGLQIWAYHPKLWEPKVWELYQVMTALKPEYRGAGVGGAFNEFVKSEFRKTIPAGTNMLIDTVADNPNIPAFQKMGYSPTIQRLEGKL